MLKILRMDGPLSPETLNSKYRGLLRHLIRPLSLRLNHLFGPFRPELNFWDSLYTMLYPLVRLELNFRDRLYTMLYLRFCGKYLFTLLMMLREDRLFNTMLVKDYLLRMLKMLRKDSQLFSETFKHRYRGLLKYLTRPLPSRLNHLFGSFRLKLNFRDSFYKMLYLLVRLELQFRDSFYKMLIRSELNSEDCLYTMLYLRFCRKYLIIVLMLLRKLNSRDLFFMMLHLLVRPGAQVLKLLVVPWVLIGRASKPL